MTGAKVHRRKDLRPGSVRARRQPDPDIDRSTTVNNAMPIHVFHIPNYWIPMERKLHLFAQSFPHMPLSSTIQVHQYSPALRKRAGAEAPKRSPRFGRSEKGGRKLGPRPCV